MRAVGKLMPKLSLSVASLLLLATGAEIGMRVIGAKPRSATVLSALF